MNYDRVAACREVSVRFGLVLHGGDEDLRKLQHIFSFSE